MISLKTFSVILANATGVSALGIYERQRALVRVNVLPTPIGRGRGNGLMATPETVSLMLLAILATDSLAETDERVARLADAPYTAPASDAACRLTGAASLRGALIALLTDEEKLRQFVGIRVSRSSLSASIYFEPVRGRTAKFSFFGNAADHAGLEVEALLKNVAFREIFLALDLERRYGQHVHSEEASE